MAIFIKKVAQKFVYSKYCCKFVVMKTKETNPAKEVLDKLVAAGMGLYEISMASGVGGASVYNCHAKGADMLSANVRKLEFLLFKKQIETGEINPRWLWAGNEIEIDGKKEEIAGVMPSLFPDDMPFKIYVWRQPVPNSDWEPTELKLAEVSRIKFLKP